MKTILTYRLKRRREKAYILYIFNKLQGEGGVSLSSLIIIVKQKRFRLSYFTDLEKVATNLLLKL